MSPEEIIAAFLVVWQTNPDKVFETSGAINSLDKLNDIVKACQTDSNEALANKLGAWCEDYPELTGVVVATGERKFDPENNIPPRQEEDRTIDNRYPEISQVLRKRLPAKDNKEDVKSAET